MEDIETPKIKAELALTLPEGMALFSVRLIIGSISLSYHILIALAPPAVR
jgi:hypothetical protein